MHYKVDYAELSPAEKQEKAIADTKDFLGEERFEMLTKNFKDYGSIEFEKFAFLCSITGVQGFPVEAWYKHIYGDMTSADQA